MFLALLLCTQAFAVESAKDPETKVSISVFDLIKRNGKTPMSPATPLQRKYVEQVLDLIRAHKAEILACISVDSKAKAKLHLDIDAEGSGEASITEDKTEPDSKLNVTGACLTALLSD